MRLDQQHSGVLLEDNLPSDVIGRGQFSCERKTAEPEQKQSSLFSIAYRIEYSSMYIQLNFEAHPRQLYCGEQIQF